MDQKLLSKGSTAAELLHKVRNDIQENIHIKEITSLAYKTRFLIIVLQFLANIIISDHEPKVFRYPKENSTDTLLDKLTKLSLGGFLRWDAQYFMHVAKYGYTYENTMAFFPLYPLCAAVIAKPLWMITGFISLDSVLLIVFTGLNIYVFHKAVIALYKLTAIILDHNLAFKSAVLFCINPATIFFVAPYTECFFSFFTFTAMLKCRLIKESADKLSVNFKSIIEMLIFVSLSACVRSNGILNIGFVAYYIINHYFNKMFNWGNSNNVRDALKCFLYVMLASILSLVPFLLVQIFHYYKFCTDTDHKLPPFLVDYARINNFVLPGMFSKYNQSWCHKRIPFAYSYVQDYYWNVGFLTYFELKQIPNFLLAFPVVFIIIRNSIRFFRTHTRYCLSLGLNDRVKLIITKCDSRFNSDMVPFVFHALFLTVFCFTSIHVQVTTRMICSASPILYWYVAYYFQEVNDLKERLMNFDFKSLNFQQKLLLSYFVGYVLIGTILFCNYLPWT